MRFPACNALGQHALVGSQSFGQHLAEEETFVRPSLSQKTHIIYAHKCRTLQIEWPVETFHLVTISLVLLKMQIPNQNCAPKSCKSCTSWTNHMSSASHVGHNCKIAAYANNASKWPGVITWTMQVTLRWKTVILKRTVFTGTLFFPLSNSLLKQ